MRDDQASLADILLAAERIAGFVTGVDRAAFDDNEGKHWAVVSQLLIIGEASRRLPDESPQRRSGVRWRAIGDMRNRLTHGYDRIDWGRVWDTAIQDMPALVAQLRATGGPPVRGGTAGG